MMQAKGLREFMRRMKEDIINHHDPAAAARYYAPDYTTHNPIPGRKSGLTGLTEALAEFFRAFPDAEENVEDVVADGDKVAAVGSIRATHRGTFAGIPGTNRRVTVNIFELHHVRDGKIQEGWVFLDVMGLMQQIAPPSNPHDGG